MGFPHPVPPDATRAVSASITGIVGRPVLGGLMSTQHPKIETFAPWVIRSKDHQVPIPVLPNDPGVVIENPAQPT